MALPGRCGYSSAPVTTGDSHSCGVTTAFKPIVDNIIASTALYWAVVICFFDWAVQKTGKTMLTAMVIALSQILLVDFNYVIAGRRAIEPALYSVGILFVVWAAVAFVYDKLSETS